MILKLNIDTKCQSGETESKKNAFTVLVSSAVVQNTKRPVKIPVDGLRYIRKSKIQYTQEFIEKLL